jgi:hypothetical protein
MRIHNGQATCPGSRQSVELGSVSPGRIVFTRHHRAVDGVSKPWRRRDAEVQQPGAAAQLDATGDTAEDPGPGVARGRRAYRLFDQRLYEVVPWWCWHAVLIRSPGLPSAVQPSRRRPVSVEKR